jgi:hypothetical protein
VKCDESGAVRKVNAHHAGHVGGAAGGGAKVIDNAVKDLLGCLQGKGKGILCLFMYNAVVYV